MVASYTWAAVAREVHRGLRSVKSPLLHAAVFARDTNVCGRSTTMSETAISSFARIRCTRPYDRRRYRIRKQWHRERRGGATYGGGAVARVAGAARRMRVHKIFFCDTSLPYARSQRLHRRSCERSFFFSQRGGVRVVVTGAGMCICAYS